MLLAWPSSTQGLRISDLVSERSLKPNIAEGVVQAGIHCNRERMMLVENRNGNLQSHFATSPLHAQSVE